jgi:hypothetical protein
LRFANNIFLLLNSVISWMSPIFFFNLLQLRIRKSKKWVFPVNTTVDFGRSAYSQRLCRSRIDVEKVALNCPTLLLHLAMQQMLRKPKHEILTKIRIKHKPISTPVESPGKTP